MGPSLRTFRVSLRHHPVSRSHRRHAEKHRADRLADKRALRATHFAPTMANGMVPSVAFPQLKAVASSGRRDC